MNIYVKDQNTLIFDDFKFKCCIGKNGFTKNKIEGDQKTPSGTFELDNLYYRKDRLKKPTTKLNTKIIRLSMGWCNDTKSLKYNKLIKISKKFKYEKMFRKDYKYDLVLPIKYNMKKVIINKGSAIFIHLTKNYKPTAGCIGLKKNDFLILLKLINKKTKINII